MKFNNLNCLIQQNFHFILMIACLVAYNQSRERHYLLKRSLLSPSKSPWRKLFLHADNKSFLEITGFSRNSFMKLEEVLFPLGLHPVLRGRPTLLDNWGLIGLILIYLNSSLSIKHICLIFAIPPTTVSDNIQFMLEKVIFYLKNHHASQIKFPTPDEMREFARLVSKRESTIKNIIGFVDGLSLPVQCSSDPEDQARMHNGYYNDSRINNVLAFSPKGKIFYASYNFPGSWHDSQVVHSLARTVVEKIGDYALCVDQGFPRSDELFDKFVGPISKQTISKLSRIVKTQVIKRSHKITSLRQSAEWGMRALQGSFVRLKSRLTSNSSKRKKILLSIFLLHNFRTHYVRINQISTVFNPHYERYINIEGYDRIARYFHK